MVWVPDGTVLMSRRPAFRAASLDSFPMRSRKTDGLRAPGVTRPRQVEVRDLAQPIERVHARRCTQTISPSYCSSMRCASEALSSPLRAVLVRKKPCRISVWPAWPGGTKKLQGAGAAAVTPTCTITNVEPM